MYLNPDLFQSQFYRWKLEGGEEICDVVKKIIEIGIPVMGHLGPTPQSISYAIPGNTLHSFEVMEDGEVVGVFTPQREDYL